MIGSVVLVLGLGVIGPNIWILWTTRGSVHSALQRVPRCDVGLVLGCAPRLTSGRDNFYFSARMRAAAQLIAAEKVQRLVVSGGPLRGDESNASEAECMKDALMRLGVRADAIELDPVGFRTRLSVQRVKALAPETGCTIVSQVFHTPRAVYLARRLGLQAHAFNAESPKFWSKPQLKLELREVIARVRAFWEP